MEIRSETKWLCENARALERYSGKWVMFNADQGVVRESDSLSSLLQKGSAAGKKPFVFHVPSKSELQEPCPLVRRR